jgi:formylglycine-generating enzyme required for sulfatase activity
MKKLNYVFCVCALLAVLLAPVSGAQGATCRECRESFPDDYNYCPYCAKPLDKNSPPKSFPRDYNYCPYCSKALADVVVNSIGMKLALIRPGSFMMGSNTGIPNEKPVHKVTLTKPFYMSVHEVTQEQYEKVMKANPAHFKAPGRPVESVSWKDAREFCRRLSEMENRRYRLATEAEWEYACRAGTDTDYYWGNSVDPRYAWLTEKSGEATHDVGTKLPNPWGLHDMSGNVWEWCQDWYGEYPPTSDEQADPQGPSEGKSRVLRGGSWFNYPGYCRSADRSRTTPGYRSYSIGFRVVLDSGE